MDARSRLSLATFDGTIIGNLAFDNLSLVHDAEGYDVMVVQGKIDQEVIKGWSFDNFIDKRLILERAGVNVPTLRTESTCFVRFPLYGHDTFSIRAYGPEYILSGRIVAYAAASAQASKTDNIDDMMKSIVVQNLGASATDTTRIISGITVAADLAAGISTSKDFAHRNVLTILKDLQEQSRNLGTEIFFRMTQNGTGWIFTTHAIRLGADRRGLGLNLSEDNENFILDSVGEDASEEISYQYAGGAGTEATRLIGTASDSARIAISPYNRREGFYNNSQAKTQASADSEAQQELGKHRPMHYFSGSIQERNNWRYGVEWDFGDILRAEHLGHTYDVMVRKVQIDITPDGETISARVEVE